MKEVDEMEHKTTEAQRRAIYKYDDKFERINCRLPAGTINRIKAAGYRSANAFIQIAVADKLAQVEFAKNKGTKK